MSTFSGGWLKRLRADFILSGCLKARQCAGYVDILFFFLSIYYLVFSENGIDFRVYTAQRIVLDAFIGSPINRMGRPEEGFYLWNTSLTPFIVSFFCGMGGYYLRHAVLFCVFGTQCGHSVMINLNFNVNRIFTLNMINQSR